MMLLKVFPQKGVIHFRKRRKLGPRFIVCLWVISRVSKVPYRLGLPSELSHIFNSFHVSQLRKCVLDNEIVVLLDDIQVDEHLDYVERTVAILERKMKFLRNKEIPLVKVQWQYQRGSEWTWESEAEMRRIILSYSPPPISRTKSRSSGGEL